MVSAQAAGQLTGVVVDSLTNEALPGATVVVDGTQIGTATTRDGTFLLRNVPLGHFTMRISFIGYKSKVLDVDSGSSARRVVKLSEDIAAFDCMVVEFKTPPGFRAEIISDLRTNVDPEDVGPGGQDSTLANHGNVVPEEFALDQNYPNPFSSETRFPFVLPETSEFSITLHDMAGRLVWTSPAEQRRAGYNELRFESAGLAAGNYIYRLTAGEHSDSRLMTIVR